MLKIELIISTMILLTLKFLTHSPKLDKKTYKDLDIYNIGFVTIKKIGHGYDVNSVNPLYLRIDNASGYIEEKGSNECLIFDSTNKNKELLKKYSCVFNGLIDEKKKSR